jgi:hypothetical protein
MRAQRLDVVLLDEGTVAAHKRTHLAVAVAIVVAFAVATTTSSAARTPRWVACDDRRSPSNGLVYVSRPRRCDLFVASDAYGEVAKLRRLHWRRWGGRVATASGTESRMPVHVRAWRPRRLCGDAQHGWLYTRMRVASERGAITVRRKPCLGRAASNAR